MIHIVRDLVDAEDTSRASLCAKKALLISAERQC